MAPVSITAHFPLGVYHGHAADGRSEPFPSPTRLLSALVNAAHIGTTAPGDGTAKPQYAAALTWLEEHPPNGICLPTTMNVRMGESRIFMHRRNGCIENNKSQFLRELHFIEARSSSTLRWAASSCSSFGSCISLRLGRKGYRRGRDAGCSSFGDCTSLRRVADRLPLAALLVAVLSGTALH